MKLLRFIGVAGLLLVLASALALVAVLRASLPTTSGIIKVAGPFSEVRISFDQWQRPYVEAGTLPDALFGQGWLHGANRLWQMELFRRAGTGRLAELLGESMLDADRELWRFGVPQLAGQLERNASPELLTLVDAYLAGVNAAIADYRLQPPEFLLLQHTARPWARRDVFALGALMAFQSGNNFRNELLRLALRSQLDVARFGIFLTDNHERRDFPFVLPRGHGNPTAASAANHPAAAAAKLTSRTVVSALDRLSQSDPNTNPLMPRLRFGSNGWVVSPSRSRSGKALYAFDSHDQLGLPNLFYEVHLFFGEGRQIRGWSVAGLPGVINGFNESIAWGFTNIGDTQDLFLETRSVDDPTVFRDGDEWYPATLETVFIPVKGREQDQELQILHTRNGPLVSDDPPLSLSWTAHHLGHRGLESVLAFNLARDWREFNKALDQHAAPTLNATYADIHGTIGFRTAGLLPLRGAGEGLEPLRGDVPGHRWQGLVDAGDMPRAVNPAAGFLAAANARVSPAGVYPLVSADNAAPYRIQRLQDYLGAREQLTVEDMQQLQLDWRDGQAEQLLPSLLSQIDRDALSPPALQALDLLDEWRAEPVASRDSGAALVFQQWYIDIAREVFAEPLGAELYGRLLRQSYLLNHALDILITTHDFDQWWRGNRGDLLARALQNTVGRLSIIPGGSPAQWRLDQRQQVGLPHELSKAIPALRHLFASPAMPWGGSPATVGRAGYKYSSPFQVGHGATVRAVAEMGEVPRVKSVIPGGQSGHPLSRHYDDQFTPWRRGALLPIGPGADARRKQVLVLRPGND